VESRGDPDEAWREGRDLSRLLFGGSAALAMAIGIGRFAYTPILRAMQVGAQLDPARAGFLASANNAGYLTGALAAAAVPQGAARGRVLLACLAMVVATTALMAGTTSLAAWDVIRFLAGLSSAGVFILVSQAILSALQRMERSSLVGWLYSGVGAGIALSAIVVQVAGGALGWRGEWLVLALLAGVMAVPAWRWLHLADAGAAPPMPARSSHGHAAGLLMTLLTLAYLLEGTGYIVTGTFLVTIVERMRGLSGFGPSVWIVVGLAAAPSTVLWTALASRVGYTPALMLAFFVQACGIAMPLLGGAVATIASAVLFGGTFMGISALTLTLSGRIAPLSLAGSTVLLTAAFGVGQIIGPVFAGQMASRTHGFSLAEASASVTVLLGGSLMATMLRLDMRLRRRSEASGGERGR
jgi:predicted MFS family arabinose efflux permease